MPLRAAGLECVGGPVHRGGADIACGAFERVRGGGQRARVLRRQGTRDRLQPLRCVGLEQADHLARHGQRLIVELPEFLQPREVHELWWGGRR